MRVPSLVLLLLLGCGPWEAELEAQRARADELDAVEQERAAEAAAAEERAEEAAAAEAAAARQALLERRRAEAAKIREHEGSDPEPCAIEPAPSSPALDRLRAEQAAARAEWEADARAHMTPKREGAFDVDGNPVEFEEAATAADEATAGADPTGADPTPTGGAGR